MADAAPICLECRRLLPEERPGDPMRCEAYPEGVPERTPIQSLHPSRNCSQPDG